MRLDKAKDLPTMQILDKANDRKFNNNKEKVHSIPHQQ